MRRPMCHALRGSGDGCSGCFGSGRHALCGSLRSPVRPELRRLRCLWTPRLALLQSTEVQGTQVQRTEMQEGQMRQELLLIPELLS